jgi:hypothetical protein
VPGVRLIPGRPQLPRPSRVLPVAPLPSPVPAQATPAPACGAVPGTSGESHLPYAPRPVCPATMTPAAPEPHRNVASPLFWALQCHIAVPQAGARAHHGHHRPRNPVPTPQEPHPCSIVVPGAAAARQARAAGMMRRRWYREKFPGCGVGVAVRRLGRSRTQGIHAASGPSGTGRTGAIRVMGTAHPTGRTLPLEEPDITP